MGRLQISVGDLSELLRPALFALAALASACVLADARRRFRLHAAAVWALLALLYPAVVLPLYLAARLFKRRASSNDAPTTTSNEGETPDAPGLEATTAEDVETAEEVETARDVEGATAAAGEGGEVEESPSRLARARAGAAAALKSLALPLAYLAAVLVVGGVYFYLDHASFDAHLARSRQAKLYNQPERTVRELRAALRVREDAHTRKLLGMELAEAGRWEEALAEFRAAARGGEPDERLAYREAFALETLNRPAEAADAYRRFLQTQTCALGGSDAVCSDARSRLARLRSATP